MISVKVATHIRARAEDLFTYTSNFENDPNWIAEVVRVDKTSEGPIGVGSTFTNHVHFLGKTFQSQHKIIAFEPYAQMIIESFAGPVSFRAIYRYTPSESGTRFSISIEGEPGGFFKLAAPLVSRRLEAQFTRNLHNLKTLFESSAPSPASQKPTPARTEQA